MTDTDRRDLQAYLNRPLDDLMAELELYDPARGAWAAELSVGGCRLDVWR